jgi:presenilin 1
MSDGQGLLEYLSRKVSKLLIPVLITLILDACATLLVDRQSDTEEPVLRLLPLPLDSSSFQESIGIAITLVISILFCTAIMVILYFMNCVSIILLWLKIGFTTIIILSVYSRIGSIVRFFNTPIDHWSVFLVIVNLTVVGNLSVFWRGPLIVTQFFLILISIFTTLLFLEFADSTFWTLMLLLIVYDMAVVLAPQGLLRVLVEKVQERGEVIPGLVYSTAPHTCDDESEETLFDDDDGSIHPQFIHEEVVLHEDPHANARRHDPGLVLGLGDFIFYGALVTRAARAGPYAVVLCIIGVMFGLCVTLVCLLARERALPALPFSLSLGGLFFLAGLFAFGRFSLTLTGSLCVF